MRKLILISILLAAGCAGLQRDYIVADQKTKQVFDRYMPTWIAAVVDTDTRADLKDCYQSWDARVKAGIASLGTE